MRDVIPQTTAFPRFGVAGGQAIAGLIEELAARGKAVLLVSSALPELLELCDRVAVMHRGQLGPARPVAELSEESLLAEATGV